MSSPRYLHTIMDTVFSRKALAVRKPGHRWVLLEEWDKAKHAPIGHSLQIKNLRSLHANRKLVKLIEDCDIWVMHRYYPQLRRIVKRFQGSKIIALQSWGPDYMRYYGGFDRFLMPETRALVGALERRHGIFKKLCVWEGVKGVRKAWIARESRRCIESLSSVHFCLPVEADDPAVRRIGQEKLSRLRFVYGSLPPYRSVKRKGVSVMIGNSGEPTNNHVEAFRSVSKVANLIDRVIVPVSYGGSKGYLESIEKLAVDMFGKKAVFLKEFMSIEDFRSLIQQCDAVVLNHVRQQAVGAYVEAVCAGCNVVLHPDGALRQWSLEAGVASHVTSSMESSLGRDEDASAANYSIVSSQFGAAANERFYCYLNDLYSKSQFV